MTGKDLIIYILANDLENEPVINENGRIFNFMTKKEVAAEFHVGIATVDAWIALGVINPIIMQSECYILPKDVKTLRKIMSTKSDVEQKYKMFMDACNIDI